MIKRKLALFLAFIMLLGILPTNVFATTNAAKPAVENGKNYEEVTIDGMVYKVYKVEDLKESNFRERRMAPTNNSRFAKPLGDPTPANTNKIKFVLELTWSTIDRPINNVKMPVYFGDPTDPRAIRLGYFMVDSVASPGKVQKFNMVDEYSGTNPSRDFLVENGRANIRIAVPVDMRYDFILAPVKWDSQQGPINSNLIFKIEGKQSVMHGYGIRWFDTNPANRDKIDARWEGKENQTSDVKLGTENRDYSVYINNVLDTNDASNVKEYPDGTKYSNYDYYYNGKKITTYADADNKGKYDSELLAIATKAQAPTASLKVKDGSDYKLKGEKVLKNNTKYLYHSVGDYRTFHVLSMREALQVKFNTGKGFLNDADKKANKANQEIGTVQEIGHSETIANNESGRIINVPDGSTLVPPAAEAGKPDNEFIGWALSKDATTALFKTQVEANAYVIPFKDKTTTFYAIYGPKDEYRAKVEYVYDNNGTETVIDKKYLKDENDPNYQTIIKGKNAGDAVQVGDVKVPTFIGFERTNADIDVTGKTYKNEKDDNKLDVIKVKFNKLDSVIPEKEGNKTNTKPDGYVTVTFKAGDHGNINGGTSDVKYFVNPKDDVTFGDTRIAVPTIKAVGDYVVKTPNWDPDLNDAKKAEKITKDAEFVAQYTEKGKHTVTFDADNGTANTTEQVTDGKTATKPATDPTKNGYTFTEWQLVNNGNVSGTAYDFSTAVTSDITLKAVYIEKDVKFEYVSEDTSKGTVSPADETIKAVTGEANGSTAAAAQGYRFTHWTKDGDKNFKVETAKLTPAKTNGIYVAAKFTAHFTKEVGVIYDLNVPTGSTATGTAPTDDTKYIKGENITVKALGNVTVEGWEFLGWNTDKDAKTANYKVGDTIAVAEQTEDITLHAIWKKQEKGVKFEFKFFEDKDGNVTATTDTKGYNPKAPDTITGKEVGSDITLPTLTETSKKVETKDYQGTWNFIGWFKNEACTQKAENPKVSATDSENKFYGKWVLTEDKKAKVHYEFTIDPAIVGTGKTVSEDHELPDGVKKQLKNAEEEKYIGTEYQPSTRFREVAEKINGKDGKWKFIGWEPKSLTVNEDDSKNKFVGKWTWYEKSDEPRCMTPAPEINPVYDSDEYITGHGIAGAVIEVRYRDYPILRTKVDTFGEWEVYTPYPLEDEQFVYARQIKEPCDPSVWVSEEIRYDDEYWRKDDKKEEPKKPVEIKKVWTPAELNARDHFSYIKGYGDNTFGPNRTITRAEVAMIFARLSINQSVSGAPQFTDVKPGDWYRRAVDIVARQGVVKGYEDGTFRPNQPITRREFAAIAARYAGNIDTWRTFRDVPSTDWAYTLINRVGGAGWITGYEDNTFRPNNLITRAEVVAIVNRMLNRKADKAYVDNNLMRSKHSFIDNLRSAWYFYDVHEAAVGHAFERQPNGVDEKWNRVTGQAFEIGKDVMYR